jgi:hypothetical protein
MKKLSTLVLMAMAMAAGPSLAQTLKSVKVEPAATAPGQAVTVTAQLELTENPNCGLHVHFGDGVSSTFKINQAKDATIVVKHSYAKAGSYTVMVEPKRVGSVLKCTGDNQKAMVSVAAAQVPAGATAAVVAAPAAAAAVASSCPDGWKLAAKSVNKKTGAFECTAKGGTAAPAKRLECPGSLTYFENTKTGRLGCRP